MSTKRRSEMKKHSLSRKDYTSFRRMNADPKAWVIRAKAYLESNLDRFIQDTSREAKLTPDEYMFHYMMDASRCRYTKATIAQLDEILEDKRIGHAEIAISEIRVEWACKYLAGVGRNQ
jgi:hypothetical protein